MRRFGVLGSIAAGTALVLAPLAAADDSTAPDLSAVPTSEIGSAGFPFSGLDWGNGDALTEFVDGNNVLLFAILNGGDQIDFENAADYLFGTDAAIAAGLAGDSAWQDAADFLQAGMSDIGGYFAIDL